MVLNTFGQDITTAGGSIVPTTTIPAQETYIAPPSITSSQIQSQSSVQVPPPPAPNPQYQGIIDSGNAILKSINDLQTQKAAQAAAASDASGQASNDLFKQMLSSIDSAQAAKPTAASLYTQDYNASGIADIQKKQTESQNKVDALNAQLQGLNYQYNTLIPEQAQQDATGRGITTVGLAPITAAQQRQKMLEIAPIQFQALVAQAENTGNINLLNAAQKHLDTIYQIHSQDAQDQYNYALKKIDAVYQFANSQEQARLDALKTKAANDFALQRDAMNNAQALAKSAMDNGQADIAAKITALDPTSATYRTDLAALQAQITQNPLDVALKQAQIGAANRSNQLANTGHYIPGSNPTVDNWAKLIIAGQASITQVPNPRGSTLRSDVVDAITNSGQVLLSDKDREKLSTLDTAFNVANTIKSMSDQINTFDAVGRVTGYAQRFAGSALQTDPLLARYEAARSGFVANVARTLGEKGALAEGDVQRAITNLPTINDTKDVAQGKLKTLFDILEGAKASIVQKSTEPLTQTSSGTLPQTSRIITAPDNTLVEIVD